MTTGLVVVIVTHNRPALLTRTLRSLSRCRLPDNFVGTIVVENGGRHGAEEVVKQADPRLKIRYLCLDSPSKSLSLNAALELLDDCLVVFFDDDVRLSPDVLCAYARATEGITRGRFFGGPSQPDYEEPPPKWLKRYFPISARGLEFAAPPEVLNEPTFPGYNWGAFATDIKVCRGFRVDLGAGEMPPGEDWEMQKALLRQGVLGVFVPEARVWHYVPGEGCSPQWALHRNCRAGMTHGIREARSGEARMKRFALPRALQRVLRKKIPVSDVLAMLTLSRRGRFAARYWYNYFRGFVRGYRIGARQQPLRAP